MDGLCLKLTPDDEIWIDGKMKITMEWRKGELRLWFDGPPEMRVIRAKAVRKRVKNETPS